MNQAGRHRPSLPPDPTGGSGPTADDVEARLLGGRRSICRRELSATASVSLLSARRFWHALGFPDVGDEDVVFTGADLRALQSVAALVRGGLVDEHAALAMTRAFARTADRLARWQTELMAEATGGLKGGSQPRKGSLRAGDGATLQADGFTGAPDPSTAQAVAEKLADIADDLEPLLIYAWRRHLSAAILRVLPDVPVGSANRAVDSGDAGDAGDVGDDAGDVGEDEGDLGP
jgi:adenylate cyclase